MDEELAIVNKILAAKAADPQADTSEYETELDWYAYHLYKLTPCEPAPTAPSHASPCALPS